MWLRFFAPLRHKHITTKLPKAEKIRLIRLIRVRYIDFGFSRWAHIPLQNADHLLSL